MGLNDGRIPPTDFLGGTNGIDPISPRRLGSGLYDYLMAWVQYYYYEFDMGAQYAGGAALGPYLTGHRASTPINPAGTSQTELIGQIPMYSPTLSTAPPSTNFRDRFWLHSQYTQAVDITTLPTPTDPLAPTKNATNPTIRSAFGTPSQPINADRLWDGLLNLLTIQSAISFTIFKYTVYGDGGNRGYYNPQSYSSTRNSTVFFNAIARMKWNRDAINLNAYNSTPYGNPLQTDPESTFNIPNYTKAWSVDIAYGTKSFSTRIDLSQGNEPLPAGEMEILFVPFGFPETIRPSLASPTLNRDPIFRGPRDAPGASGPLTRDNRITQPRIKKWVDRETFERNYTNFTRGGLILKSDVVRLVIEATSAWFTGDYNSTTYFERLVCHASCHGSCHASRGRR